MKCHEHGEPLCALADDELPEKQLQRLQQHLEDCPQCRAELWVINALKATVREHARSADLPEGFWLGVRARMTELDRAARRATRPTLFLPPAFAVASVIAITLAVAAVIWQSQQRPLPVEEVLLPPPGDMTVGYRLAGPPVTLSFTPRVVSSLPQSRARLVGVYPRRICGQEVASLLYDLEGTPIMLHEAVGPGFCHPDLQPVEYRGRLYNHAVAQTQDMLTWADEPLEYLMHGSTSLDRLLTAADDVR